MQTGFGLEKLRFSGKIRYRQEKETRLLQKYRTNGLCERCVLQERASVLLPAAQRPLEFRERRGLFWKKPQTARKRLRWRENSGGNKRTLSSDSVRKDHTSKKSIRQDSPLEKAGKSGTFRDGSEFIFSPQNGEFFNSRKGKNSPRDLF